MKITGLFSGSSGNCILLENEGVKLLIDAGVSAKAVMGALEEIGVSAADIDAILITHEHDDHVKGAGILSRKLDLPIYANPATMHASLSKLGKIKEGNLHTFNTGEAFEIKGTEILPFSISHDAKDPVGYSFNNGKNKAVIATDTGIITDEIFSHLKGAKCAFIESNHDIHMLKSGPYPPYLKERILSEVGHISNEAAAALCKNLIENGTTDITLGHLSRHNNTPLLAMNTVKNYLEKENIIRGRDYSLNIALHDRVSETMEV